jgi:hypothetical protein
VHKDFAKESREVRPEARLRLSTASSSIVTIEKIKNNVIC